MEQVEIVPAAVGHAAAIARIYNEAVLRTTATFDTEERTEARTVEWLGEHGDRYPVVVALRGGRVIGWASASRYSDRGAYGRTAEVSVYVDEPERGRGVGGRLLAAVVHGSRQAGLHTLLSRITGGNEVSVRLHRGLGFEPVGVMREVGHKFGRWIDVHLMQLMLERGTQR